MAVSFYTADVPHVSDAVWVCASHRASAEGHGPVTARFGKYRFLRCDTTPTGARLAYSRDADPDAAQERIEFMVILFNLESGSWKVSNMGSADVPKKGATLDEATKDPRLQLPRT